MGVSRVKTARPPKLLVVVLILLCVENLARVGLAVQQAVELPALPTALTPTYVALTSAVWAMAFASCLVGAIGRRTWSPVAVAIVTIGYQVYLWVTRLAFARSTETFATLGFRALLSAVTLAIIFLLLALWRLKRQSQARVHTAQRS